MHLHIRPLEVNDFYRGFLETLAAVAPVGLTPGEAEAIWHDPERQAVRTFVALDGDRVVGTVSLLVERKFIHRGGRVGHIEEVAVHPDYRGRQIGSRLVEHATEEGVRLGCYKVILNCKENLQEFYGQLGYRRHDCGMRYDAPASGS